MYPDSPTKHAPHPRATGTEYAGKDSTSRNQAPPSPGRRDSPVGPWHGARTCRGIDGRREVPGGALAEPAAGPSTDSRRYAPS